MNTNNTFFFNEETNQQQMDAITNAYNSKGRVRLWFGDTDGKSWNEEFDTIGRIGRSTGVKPIALLIKNSRSMGGAAILTQCIVKMTCTKTGRTLYKHPNFNQAKFEANGLTVTADGILWANCRDEKQAQRLAAFMNGERNSK